MSGYYSWVCFIDVQRGGWFGPIQYSEIDDYNRGFALDRNIKSWTAFQYYSERPSFTLTCNFTSAETRDFNSPETSEGTPKTATFSQCQSSSASEQSDTSAGQFAAVYLWSEEERDRGSVRPVLKFNKVGQKWKILQGAVRKVHYAKGSPIGTVRLTVKERSEFGRTLYERVIIQGSETWVRDWGTVFVEVVAIDVPVGGETEIYVHVEWN